MKFLAIVDVAAGADIARIRAELQSELKASWALFASGVMREAYATEKPTRVVFVVEAADRGAADNAFDSLPLVAGGLFRVELIELHPFVNWSMLFGA